MKKILGLVLAVTLSMAAFTGCGKNDNNENKANGNKGNTAVNNKDNKNNKDNNKEEDDKPVVAEKKVLRLDGNKTKTLNPHAYETTAESEVMELIYANLLAFVPNAAGDNYEIVPDHAAEMPTISEDGTVWTFKLREGLQWSDGTPIDANSYEYTYKMLLDPTLKNYRADMFFSDLTVPGAEAYFKGEGEWEDVGIKALDAQTLQITLEFAVPKMSMYTSFTTGGVTVPIKEDLFEASWNEDRTENSYGTSLETTPTSGPYVLTQWIRDQVKVYTKNDSYPLASYYHVDEIDMRVVEEAAVRVQLFENGELDYTSLSSEYYEKYEEDPRVTFASSTTVWSMFLNMASEENPVLQDLNFRRAMYIGADRAGIIPTVYATATPANYIVSSGKYVGDTGVKYRDTEQAKKIVDGVSYDPELAVELFEKAYAANGNKMITLELQYFDTSENLKKLSEAFEQSFENLFGKDKFDLVLRAVPWMTVYDNMEAGDYEAAFGGWAGSRFDPWGGMFVYTSMFTGKLDKFYNDEFDELYERTCKGDLLFETDKKLDALVRMEELLIDNAAFMPLWEPRTPFIFADYIKLPFDGKHVPGVGFGLYFADIVK
jgi:oligopeptide transport system substrate-binding protein